MISTLLCLALAPLAPHSAQAPVDPLSCVPEDALMFVSVQQLDALRADGRENAWYRMLLDADFDPAWEALRQSEGWKEAFEGSNDDVDPLEFLASIHGSITVFVNHGANIEQGSGGLLIDPGEERAEFERLFDELIAAKVDTRVFSYETYQGLELALMEHDAGADGAPSESSLFIETEQFYFLLFGTDPEALLESARTAVDQFQGESSTPALAQSALLAEARAGSEAPGRIELFLNTRTLMDMLPEEADEEFWDEDGERIIEALGVPQMTWVHAWMDLGRGEQSDFELSFRLPDEGYLLEWAGYFQPAPRRLAALMPDDSNTIGLFGYDTWSLYQSAWDLFEELFPEKYAAARTQFEGLGQSIGGVDIEGDLLAQLTGEIASFRAPVPEAEWLLAMDNPACLTPGQVPQDLLFGDAFLLGLHDADLVELTIEDLFAFLGMIGAFDPATIETEEFQGLEIQTTEQADGSVGSWCFDKDLLVFSMFPSMVRSVLRLRGAEGEGSALKNEDLVPYFKEQADASYLGLADSKSVVRTMLEGLSTLQALFPDLGDEWAEIGSGDEAENDDSDRDLEEFQIPGPEVADRYLEGIMISTLHVEGTVLKLRYSTR